ncbi:MAG: hypothetical protein ACRBM6_13965 [Geminicoccales bacterium]
MKSSMRVVYFGHDRTDSKVISRIEGLRKLGFHVLGLTYHRIKFNRGHEPTWENVDLGTTADYAYLRRIQSLVMGALRLIRHRKRFTEADLVFARNIDMALLALFARLISGSQAPIAYEVLDVHRLFLGKRRRNRVMRAIERWMLNRVEALIVSSEGYIRNYFEPTQNYRGHWFLLENKVPSGSISPVRTPPRHRPKELGRPWVIGWCGTMRCLKSLELLTEIARRHRDTVQVYMRGYPTEISQNAFMARIENEPNMIYGGGYKGPDDLADVYAEVDLNWTIDLSDASYKSDNSFWLLPNRLYEGGCCHVPAIAMVGTETARKVEALDIGWLVEEPLVESVSKLLSALTKENVHVKQKRLKSLPPSILWERDDLSQICHQLLALGSLNRDELAPTLDNPAS